jgi:hypothetical protein
MIYVRIYLKEARCFLPQERGANMTTIIQFPPAINSVADTTRDERELRELEERQHDTRLIKLGFIECPPGVDRVIHEEVQRYMTVEYNSLRFTDPRTFRHGHAHLVAKLAGTTYKNRDDLYAQILDKFRSTP